MATAKARVAVTLMAVCMAVAACTGGGSNQGSAPVKNGGGGAPESEGTGPRSPRTGVTGPGTTTGQTGTTSQTSTTVPNGAPPQIGANFNGDICNIDNALVNQSNVQWVRAYINLARNYLTYDSNGVPDGVNSSNISQGTAHASPLSDMVTLDTVNRLQQVKIAHPGVPIKVILSVKLDFYYQSHVTPPSPDDPSASTTTAAPTNPIVPAAGTPVYGFWSNALQQLLTANGNALGNAVDILVIGNEPMFETPTDAADVTNFQSFLGQMVTDANSWKKSSGLNYGVYVGAINKASQDTNTAPGNAGAIAQAITTVANQDYQPGGTGTVQGLDLHLHETKLGLAAADIAYVKNTYHVQAPLIATEFSLVGLWDQHANDPLDTWATSNPQLAGGATSVAGLLDVMMQRAAAGTANGTDSQNYAALTSYFSATNNQGGGKEGPPSSWYPAGWFASLVQEMAGVTVATYGLAAPISPQGSGAAAGCAAQPNLSTTGPQDQNDELWVLNFVYSGALLGYGTNGFYQTNPLLSADFAAAVNAGNSAH